MALRVKRPELLGQHVPARNAPSGDRVIRNGLKVAHKPRKILRSITGTDAGQDACEVAVEDLLIILVYQVPAVARIPAVERVSALVPQFPANTVDDLYAELVLIGLCGIREGHLSPFTEDDARRYIGARALEGEAGKTDDDSHTAMAEQPLPEHQVAL